MTSSASASRWKTIVLLSIVLLLSSCRLLGQAPTGELSKAPSNFYLISYANSFVGELRAGGEAAGAFEISRHTDADGLYHLRVELMENDQFRTLDLIYEGRDSGLEQVSCHFEDGEEVGESSALGLKLTECHKVADSDTRAELDQD